MNNETQNYVPLAKVAILSEIPSIILTSSPIAVFQGPPIFRSFRFYLALFYSSHYFSFHFFVEMLKKGQKSINQSDVQKLNF
jgi:hypothetical protein